MLLVIVAVISGRGSGERNGGIMLMEMVEVMFILVLMVLVVSCYDTYYKHTRHKRYDAATHKDTLVTAQTYRSCHISKT